MRSYIAGFIFLAVTTSHNAFAALGCGEFLSMQEAQQLIFVRGLVDGMGTTLGVTDSFSHLLIEQSSSPEEKAGITQMHDAPIGILSKGFNLGNREITQKIVKGCRARPERPVGNMLTDVMVGDL